MTSESVPRTYPWTTRVGDLEVTFRVMSADDRELILTFTRTLTERDLLFLPFDITREEVIDDWIRHVEEGRTRTLLAVEGGRMIGYCSLRRSEILWTRHLGEIHLLVDGNYRGKGVGGILARRVFELAQEDTDFFKLVVNMMSTQRDAQNIFHHLGFIPEAMLHDWAIDRNGRTHDLIIMSREVEDDDGEAVDSAEG
jgi:RimJ/RimL family protein N-acetyltransferase